MDVGRVMAKYQGRLAFGVAFPLSDPCLGTPDDVRAEVRQMRELGRGGGYILSPSHALEGGDRSKIFWP